MNISPHFKLEEFIPKNVYTQFGYNSVAFVDPRIVAVAEFVRNFFGKPVTINNWYKGGQFNYRGFRDPKCTIGAKFSQHRFGRAIDINVQGMSSQEVYRAILSNQDVFMKAGLTTVENIVDTPTWNHLDCRVTNMGTIKIVKPI